MCQRLERKDSIDWKRAARMTAFGAFALGPCGHYWYRFLDTRFPSTAMRAVLLKVAADQFVFSPAFYVAFFSAMPLMEGKPWSNAISNVVDRLPPTYAVDFCVWPAAQILNFRYVAATHRVLYVGAVSVFWNCFLSYMQHSGTRQLSVEASRVSSSLAATSLIVRKVEIHTNPSVPGYT